MEVAELITLHRAARVYPLTALLTTFLAAPKAIQRSIVLDRIKIRLRYASVAERKAFFTGDLSPPNVAQDTRYLFLKAWLLARGIGCDKDESEALRLYGQIIKHNDDMRWFASVEHAIISLRRSSEEIEKQRAVLREGYAKGVLEAGRVLARATNKGEFGVPADARVARNLYFNSLVHRNTASVLDLTEALPSAAFELAHMEEHGIGGIESLSSARMHYAYVAAAGDVSALYSFATVYQREKDYKNAALLYKEFVTFFSENKDRLETQELRAMFAEAAYRLACLYEKKRVTPVSEFEAEKYFLIAAEFNHIRAQDALGQLYLQRATSAAEPEHKNQLMRKAFHYFSQAARIETEEGLPRAWYHLAKLLWRGEYCERNKPEALRLMRLAVSEKYTSAVDWIVSHEQEIARLEQPNGQSRAPVNPGATSFGLHTPATTSGRSSAASRRSSSELPAPFSHQSKM